MFNLEREYTSNFSFKKISKYVKDGTLLELMNSNNKFIKKENDKFFYSLLIDSEKYPLITIPFKYNINIIQKIISEEEDNIVVELEYIYNEIHIFQVFYVNINKIKTTFSYELKDDDPILKIIIDIILYSCLDWMETRIIDLSSK